MLCHTKMTIIINFATTRDTESQTVSNTTARSDIISFEHYRNYILPLMER